MSWWGWLIVGIVLAGAELMTDAAFYLVFAGVAAIVVGLVGLAGVGLPVWAQWVAFSALSVSSMVLFRRKFYDGLRSGSLETEHPVVGTVVDLDEELAPGRRTRIPLQGTVWTAVNIGSAPIPRGTGAVVVDTDGVELQIMALSYAQHNVNVNGEGES